MKDSIEALFRKTIERDSKIQNGYFLVHSDQHHIKLAGGKNAVHPDQPFFIASVGKLFTSVLIGIFVEKGTLAYDDPLSMYLDEELMNRLHVFKGLDYSPLITVKQLLQHTSGLPDYFEEKPKTGEPPMLHHIFNSPTREWTPEEVIRWTKRHLTPHFPPGRGFHYSDTGYHLLGLLIEKLTGTPFHEALQTYLFTPLQMKNSYLLHHSEPLQRSEYPVAGVYRGSENAIEYRSLGIDYAGGGIVSTTEDLLLFMKALVEGELLSERTFQRMQDWSPYSSLSFLGINYGYGLMSFKEIPLLFPKKYHVWGNAGMTGTFLFYHPELRTYFIGGLNQFRYHRKGIQLMFKAVNKLTKQSTKRF